MVSAGLALAGLGADTAAAQAPVNDTFANAQLLTGTDDFAEGTNVAATGEPGEPNHAGASLPLGSVWYRWTAPATAPVVIETCESDFDTTLAVYTGTSVGGLTGTEVASNDDSEACGPDATASLVLFRATGGTPYRIAVDGSGDAEGEFVVGVFVLPPPFNDDFAEADVLTGSDATFFGYNVPATGEPGEPDHAGASLPLESVWYRWTPLAPGTATVSTCESNFDTTLAVYTGTSVNAVAAVATTSSPCGPGGAQEFVSFVVTPGTTYHVAVDGAGDAEGVIGLTVGGTFVPPANDDFALGQVLSGTTATVSGRNFAATGEAGEPVHARVSDPLESVWYRWTAPANGTATFDTCGSDYDTTLAVYTGTSVRALTEVASIDDSDFCGAESLQSAVRFTATGGTTYQIAVDGFDTDEGSIVLHLNFGASPPPPPPPPPPPQPPQPERPPPPGCTIGGTAGDDVLTGTPGNDVICGLGGDDTVRAGGGRDVVKGGSGGDTIVGQTGDDRLLGEGGGDRIRGGTGKDRVVGGAGGDRLQGDGSSDVIRGDAGDDILRGGAGNDRLAGGRGRDQLSGMAGNDTMLARDRIRDRVNGGAGTDRGSVDRADRVRSVERRF